MGPRRHNRVVRNRSRLPTELDKSFLLFFTKRTEELAVGDQLSAEGVWLPQYAFLGGKRLMDDIADAIAKIQDNRDQLTKV